MLENKIQQNNRTIIFLEGGHFKTQTDISKFSVISLNDSIVLGKYLINKFKKKVKVIFGILVDDIGQECGVELCTTNVKNRDKKESSFILVELKRVLEKFYLREGDIILFYEKTTKNRSAKYLRKTLLNQSSHLIEEFHQNESCFYLCNDQIQEKILLAKRRDKVFGIYCPLIMGQHYADVFTKINN